MDKTAIKPIQNATTKSAVSVPEIAFAMFYMALLPATIGLSLIIRNACRE